MTEIRVELLLGRKVVDVDGKKVGRVEEIRGDKNAVGVLVEDYLVGAYAHVERLAAWSLVRPIRGILGKSVYSMYRIRWEEMDLSDPNHPRLTVPKSELRRLTL